MFALKQWLYFTPSPMLRHFLTVLVRGISFVLLLSYATWSTAQTEIALIDRDVQLRGSEASFVAPILVPSSQYKPVQLKLQWNISGLVDPKRSIVNVWVNGQIRSTRRLSDTNSESWTLSLRSLKTGQQEIKIQVYLRGKDEDCNPLQEGLWLTLLPSSTIVGASPLSKTATASVAVRDFPNAWRSPVLMKTSGASNVSKSHVNVAIEHVWDRAVAAAFTQTQIYLTQQGLASIQLESDSSEAGQLILRSFDRLEPKHPARDRWALAADTLFVLYASGKNRLEIITKDSRHIPSAIEMLANDALRALCHEALCSSSSVSTASVDTLKGTKSTNRKDLLWSMEGSDQPRGWIAQGAGAHKLRQVWVRPIALNFQSEVSMFLAARASKAAQLDVAQSSISLRINDQPVATYSLQDWKAEHASVRIPESLWRAAVWVIDFEVRLIPRPQQRCSYLVQEDFWLALDSTTRLNAKFDLREAGGIAGFWQHASEQPTLSLAWSEAGSPVPKREQLALFIPLLQAFASRPMETAAPRWIFVDQATCNNNACIVLHPPQASVSTQERLLQWRAAFGKIPQQAQWLPDFNVAGTAVIAWTPQEGSKADQLHLILGVPKDTPIAIPQLGSFLGPIAVHTDQWQYFGNLDDNVNNSAQNKGSGNISQQQGRLRWVNLIWALLSLVIVVALAMLYWRKKKKADQKTWEVN